MSNNISLIDISNIQNGPSVVAAFNSNNDTIEQAFANTVSLAGTTPNSMLSTLDMNNNRLINLASPVASNDAVTLSYMNSVLTGNFQTATVSPFMQGVVSASNTSAFQVAVNQPFSYSVNGSTAFGIDTQDGRTYSSDALFWIDHAPSSPSVNNPAFSLRIDYHPTYTGFAGVDHVGMDVITSNPSGMKDNSTGILTTGFCSFTTTNSSIPLTHVGIWSEQNHDGVGSDIWAFLGEVRDTVSTVTALNGETCIELDISGDGLDPTFLRSGINMNFVSRTGLPAQCGLGIQMGGDLIMQLIVGIDIVCQCTHAAIGIQKDNKLCFDGVGFNRTYSQSLRSVSSDSSFRFNNTNGDVLTVSLAGGLSVNTTSDPGAGMIYTNSASFMNRTKTSWNNGASGNTATLTNAPAATNPTKWIPVDDNGTTRYIPAW